MTIANPRPIPLPIQPEAIPPEFKSLDRWALWAYRWSGSRWTKTPRRVSQRRRLASIANYADWTSFQNALRIFQLDQKTGGDIAGIGFLLAGEGFTFIDIDKCLNPAMSPSLDALTSDARQLVERFDSFTEVSPSGTGLHVVVRAKLPGPGRRRNGVEIYDRSRFFALTGVRLAETRPEIAARQSAVEALYASLASGSSLQHTVEGLAPTAHSLLSDDDVLYLAGRGNARGDAFDLLYYAGDTSIYRSPSEADLALCGRLAFFCNGDVEQIRRLFLQSALARRSKIHARPAYVSRTIARAIGGCRNRFFTPSGERR